MDFEVLEIRKVFSVHIVLVTGNQSDQSAVKTTTGICPI